MTRGRGRASAAMPVPSGRGARMRAQAQMYAAALSPDTGEGWTKGLLIVLAMIGTVAIKLHELVPTIAVMRPALVITGLGILILLAHTPKAALVEALQRPLAMLILGYFAWCVLTVPMSVWPANSFETMVSLVPLVFLVIAIVTQPPTLKNTDRLQYWLVILFAVYGLYGRAAALTSGRLKFGFTYGPNDIAALMAIGFPLAVGIALRSTARRRVLAIGAAVVCIITIVLTRSRGGFVGLGAGTLMLIYATRGARKIDLMVAVAFGAVLTWSMSSEGFRRRMTSMTTLEDDFNVTSEIGRKAIWARGFQYLKDNPVLGVGVGNFSTAEGSYWMDLGTRMKWSSAHNAYIHAYAELGVPGGTLFIAIMATGFVIAWRMSRGVVIGGVLSRRPEYLASMTSFAVSGIFLSHAYFSTYFVLVSYIALIDHAAARSGGVVTGAPAARPMADPPVRTRVPGQRGGYAYVVAHRDV